MFIRLIPTPPLSPVLFAVTYPDIDESLPLPNAWVEQLHVLKHDGLDSPPTIHALDRAAGLVGIVTEITFDIPALVITCKMLDGTVEEWPLMEKGCLRALEDVVADVHESAESDRETVLENERGRSAESPPPLSGKVTRHKKQRSLLMSLVA